MELIMILRELWRLRLFVVIVTVVAIAAGTAVSYRVPSLESRKYEVGVATTRILVDTPNSQVVEVAPKGSDMLGVRANLIASLMAEGDVKNAIAERAGVPADEVEGIAESASALATAPAATPGRDATVLITRVLASADGERLPIIEVEVQAPDAARAATIAKASVEGLSGYLASKAATERVTDAQRLRVSGLGSVQARDVVRGPKTIFAVAAALLVFVVGCALVLIVPAIVRGWRAASELEAFERQAHVTPIAPERRTNGSGEDVPAHSIGELRPLFGNDAAHEGDRGAPRGTGWPDAGRSSGHS